MLLSNFLVLKNAIKTPSRRTLLQKWPIFQGGDQKGGNPIMTTSTVTARREADPQHYVEGIHAYIYIYIYTYICTYMCEYITKSLSYIYKYTKYIIWCWRVTPNWTNEYQIIYIGRYITALDRWKGLADECAIGTTPR